MPKKPVRQASKRVRRTPEQARQLILEAAVATLAERGPNAVGLKDVAKAAGVSHALVGHYFGTYEALVDAAVGEAMSTVRTRLIERLLSLPEPTPEAMFELYFEIALEPWHGRLVTWALFSDREGAAGYAERIVSDMKLIVLATEHMLRRGSTRPAASRREAEALLVSVWSLVVGYVAGNQFFWRALGHKPGPSRDRDLREVVKSLTRVSF